MEPLWSPVVATGGTQWQNGSARNPPKQAESVAVGCERLPEKFHGKQGVCRGLPPVAGGPLPAKEEVDLLKNAKSCEPEGLMRFVDTHVSPGRPVVTQLSVTGWKSLRSAERPSASSFARPRSCFHFCHASHDSTTGGISRLGTPGVRAMLSFVPIPI